MNGELSGASHVRRGLRALRHGNYRIFFLGQTISLVGTWMQTVAQQWLVYGLTGSAAMLGTINFLALLPVGPLSLLGGSLADRASKRSLLVATQSAMMVLAFILAALTWAGTVEIWQVMLVAMALGAATAIDVPARQAFVVELVESRDDVASAVGLNAAITNTARAIGPAIGGALVAMAGTAGAFLLNGLTFIPMIAGLLFMRLPVAPRKPKQPGLGSHLREAIRYVWGKQEIGILITMVAVSAFLSVPYTILLPVFAKEVLAGSAQPFLTFVCTGASSLVGCQSPDALTYGFLMAASGLGALIGAFFVAALPSGAVRGRWLTIAYLGFPALLFAMAFSRSFALSLLLLLGIGFCFVTQNVLANTLIQVSAADALRGRVMSFYALALLGMQRVGGIQAGVIGDLYGAPMAVGIGAAICLIFGLVVTWRYPKIRQLV